MPGLIGITSLGGGFFLGWTLGANDAANAFGTAVATRIISYRKACVLCGVAVMIGATMQGHLGIATLSTITQQSISTAVVVSISAAVTAALMTYLSIPISTSQAVVGAIFGVGLLIGQIEYSGLIKVALCWVLAPIGSMIIACIVHKFTGWVMSNIPMSMLTRDKLLWGGLIVVGTYGSYALGANNVANSTGIFSGLVSNVNDRHLAIIGGLSIAVGVFTYSKKVMMAVGGGVMPLDAFSAFVSVLSMSITVHIFAVVGAPVSTSQSIIGAIIGIGLMRGITSINYNVLWKIGFGWILTPVISIIFAMFGYSVFC